MTFRSRLLFPLLGLLLLPGVLFSLSLLAAAAGPVHAAALPGKQQAACCAALPLKQTAQVTGTVDEEEPPPPGEVFTTYVYLPFISQPDPSICPTSSTASYNLMPIDGQPADHPDYLHGDLNLSLRGYAPTGAFAGLVDYSGSTDPDAPYLGALFEPQGFHGIQTVYQVRDWIWGCGEHGCPGEFVTNPEVTLIGLRATPGQAVYVPERTRRIWDNQIAMVLYAEEKRITIGYTRNDSVAFGYAIQLENVCVDPNLLALYRAQIDSQGERATGRLPGLEPYQALGTAGGTEIQVATRDRGTYLDPRSRKDWW